MFEQRNMNPSANIDPKTPALLFVCSDGIWDNWKFQDVVRYMETHEPTVLNSGKERGAAAGDSTATTETGFSYRSAANPDSMDGIYQSTDDITLGMYTFMFISL